MGCGTSSRKVHAEAEPGRGHVLKALEAFPEFDVPLPTVKKMGICRGRRSASKDSSKDSSEGAKLPKPGFAICTEGSEEDDFKIAWSSWDSAHWRGTYAKHGPQPPDRRLHEFHLHCLDQFRTQVEKAPRVFLKAVKAKRILRGGAGQ